MIPDAKIEALAAELERKADAAERRGVIGGAYAGEACAAEARAHRDDAAELRAIVAEGREAIDAAWLRSLTDLPVCKSAGQYPENEVTLFLNDWESTHKQDCERFWVLRFSKGDDGWQASVSVQEKNRHNGTLYMVIPKTRADVLALCEVLGIPLESEVSR